MQRSTEGADGGRRSAGAMVVATLVLALASCPSTAEETVRPRWPWAEIRVVDPATGRGVPIAELETVNGLRFVTDDLGRVAFLEPGLMDREVFFHVRSHGHEMPADGFGFRGARVVPRAGESTTIELPKTTIAERICRLTGEGRLRDSILLGRVPLPARPIPGGVVGQDSVQAVEYGGRVHWFWGDTRWISYPLGLFRTAGATTPIPTEEDPPIGPLDAIPYDYLAAPGTPEAPEGFVRPLMPLPERPEGVIWIDGACVVPDADGRGRLVAHYSRRRGLDEEFEQGIAVWDDATATFVVARQLPLTESWRRPATHPMLVGEESAAGADDGAQRRWVLFGAPTPNVRVPATYEAVLDPDAYEAFTPADDAGNPRFDAEGRPAWRWQREIPPAGGADERRWIAEGRLDAGATRFLPAAADSPQRRVRLHSGTVRYNAWRRRWILVAGEIDGAASHLGEVWYAEAEEPTGPFSTAVRIASHAQTSFYNVCHHDFLDRDGGRTIHFEGTLTRDFSGSPIPIPRAEYNQVLYRLDLDSPDLAPSRR